MITLIGMSGSGKSHWSAKLSERGFARYCCDDMIEERLGIELKALGYSGIHDVAKWMGQPYAPQYPMTSRRYLDLEGEVTSEALAKIEESGIQRGVIDTTGSVIYLEGNILQELRARTRLVYLETPDSVKEEMYRLYIAYPKPVIWGDSFSRANGETDTEALGRCYPRLLAYRTARYASLAHMTLDFYQLRNPDFTLDDFIAAIAV